MVRHLSPAKTVSSEDTRESAASSVDAKEEIFASSADAKEEDSAETIWEANQKLLPSRIRKRKYSKLPEEADKQLWKDIHEEDKISGGSLLDKKFLKYIFIDAETRKAYVNMPSTYHYVLVTHFRGVASCESTASNPVLVETHGCVELTTGSTKEPDIFIYGQDRLKYNNKSKGKPFLTIKNIGLNFLNPSAIIEVSWTNKIEDELEKFALAINKRKSKFGAIHVGYLIKFIPLQKSKMPTKENQNLPLVGIDVYKMKSGDKRPAPGGTFLRWRYGDKNYPADLKITGEELGQETGGKGVSIAFEDIVVMLTDCGVVFKKPDEN